MRRRSLAAAAIFLLMGTAGPAASARRPAPVSAPPPTTPDPTTPAGPAEGGSVAGPVVPSSDPAAGQAQADLEGEALDRPAKASGPKMAPLQVGAWWTMFGTVVLATAGGVFSGLAERQEDEAERLALGFDLETGARFQYEDKAAEYEEILERGVAYQWASRGFLIGAGAAFAASITLFCVHAARTRPERRRGKLALRGLGPGGLEVAF